MSNAMRATLKRWVERAGLLGVAFRVHEYLKAREARRRHPAAFRGLAADGLPMPPAGHLVLVGGETNAEAFLQGGAHTAQTIRSVLAAHGADIGQFRAILDFGCGCGRVMRHWQSLPGRVELHGTDYNAALIEWSRKNLPFGRFHINSLAPPLSHADGSFDLVYAFSVFTHLTAALQVAWIAELTRVLAPGGYLFITVHGESFRNQLSVDEARQFDAGDLVVRHAGMAGSNLCAAFHPLPYLRRMAGELEVIDHRPALLGQDVVLLRKRAA
ncbi:class I SAM-dependent methyltransferase [Tahibacter amnicola]|uniref:Class I SAM-dependent methyltransferase n=1 Tax=Tahibacter amnicola TaxID=2976241 RepID=A0ABY6BJB3_9GAMM|nr:class I SAM-dependent methyltransferase [Tahibacter amnicola]UXI70103.1 class I SAM-dependent methyltransferase [Tahibacter amnicola]